MLGIMLYLIASIVLGCLFCFGGKNVYFIFLKCIGIAASAAICFTRFGITWLGFLLFAVLSVAIWLLVEKVYKVGFFIGGALLGLMLGGIVAVLLPDMASSIKIALVVLSTIGCGLCAVIWSELFIVLSTAYNGAYMIAVPVLFLVKNLGNLHSYVWADGSMASLSNLITYLSADFHDQNGLVIFIMTIFIAIGGVIFQKRVQKRV